MNMTNNRIKVMIDNVSFDRKPVPADVKKIVPRLGKDSSIKEVTMQELAQTLIDGYSIKPAICGTKQDEWREQQIFAVDVDDGMTIEAAISKCEEIDMLPAFIYTTFSHIIKGIRFRIVFVLNDIITDFDKGLKIQNTLNGLFNADQQCKNLNRVFYGGRDIVYEGYDNVIDIEVLLESFSSEFFDYNNRCYNNTNYLSRKNHSDIKPKKSDDINYNIQAIKEQNIEYLRSVLNIKEGVDIPNEQEFYTYIRTEIDLPELLGLKYWANFKCVIHNDSNPSAGIFVADDGAYMYNCFGCGFKGNVIHVIQALTGLKTYKVLEFVKDVYRINIVKTDWQKEQTSILEINKHMLLNGDIERHYPDTYKLIKRYIPQLIMLHDIAIMNVRDENFTDQDGNIVFFVSNSYLTELMDSKSNKRINQRNVLFAFLKLLKKLDKDDIPKEDFERALQIQKERRFPKRVNYFSIGDYDIYRMKSAEERAGMWLDNNMSMTSLSYEGLYRTFGYDVASELYPQHKTQFVKSGEAYKEVERTVSKSSDDRTLDISKVILDAIENKGYVTESEVVEQLRWDHGKGFIHKQLKRSLKEILDAYGLTRIRANKDIKEKLGIESNGYPFVIIKEQ